MPMNISGRPCGANDRGFSLLEVLVALMVLMVGLLGLTSLEMMAMRKNHDSYLRNQAILQAQDMADRMHANEAGVKAGAYDTTITTTVPVCISTSTTPVINCTPIQIARYDINEWNTNNANLLPSGAGTITGPDVNGRFTITESWTEIEQSGADTKSFSFKVKPLP